MALEKVLLYLIDNSGPFKELLTKVVNAATQPLRLILYCDGITPGNAMGFDNKRKSIIWYASFLEFGILLCHEEVWITIASARTVWAKKVPAGVSGLTRRILREMFIDQDIAGRGIRILGQLLRVCFHALLADEEALNAMLYIKGASGLVPCAVLCCAVNKPLTSDLEGGRRSMTQRSALLQDIGCSDVRLIGLKSDADVWAQADEVAASKDTPGFKLKETTRGMSYHEDALLFDIPLRQHFKPASSTSVDAMHVVFSNGVLPGEIMLLLEAMKKRHGFYFQSLRDYLGPWKWSQIGEPADCFNKRREKSSNAVLKIDASHLLAVYPAVRVFVVEALGKSTRLVNEIDSFLSICAICDLLVEALHCPAEARALVIADLLTTAVATYLEAFKKAYGLEAVRFKHHQLLHLPGQIRRDKRLLACWTLERKHITAKQAFSNFCQASVMPAGALARMVNAQVRERMHACMHVYACMVCISPRCRPPHMRTLYVSHARAHCM